tara:strand:- start:5874 stop:7931 length:2058 start_codon:yes stop_codon:yes gene_type:complete
VFDLCFSNHREVGVFALGAFDIETLIGRGGVSEVWRGQHQHTGEQVAIKIAHHTDLGTTPHAHSFREEARLMASLHHPGIISLYDYGRLPADIEETSQGMLFAGSPYLILELASNALHHYSGQLDWPTMYRVQMAILDALGYIHAKGLLHRDIKPSNLLISKTLQQVKISDFGIAATYAWHDDLHTSRLVMGTPSYMAPEQFHGNFRDFGPWTDLYAFGCTIYELLTGSPPFGHMNILESMREAHLYWNPPGLPVECDVPPGYQEWLDRLLTKSPAMRFQRAADAAWTLAKLQAQAEHQDPTTFSLALPQLPQPLKLEKLPTLVDTQPLETFRTTGGAPLPCDVEGRAPAATGHHPRLPQTGDFPTIEVDVLQLPTLQREPPPMPQTWPQYAEYTTTPFQFEGLGPESLREQPLFGREQEQHTLWSALQRVHNTRRPRMVCIRGAAGTGKTRLARWLCQVAHQTGQAHILTPPHPEQEQQGQSLRSMLLHFVMGETLEARSLSYQLHTRTPHPHLAPPETWEPLAHWLLDEPPFERAQETQHLLRPFFEAIAKERPCIVWLDELMWDVEALEWLRDVLDKWHNLPILCVVSLTPTTSALLQESVTLLATLLEHQETDIIELETWEKETYSQFVQHLLDVDEALIEPLYTQTKGHPRMTIEQLIYWLRHKQLKKTRSGWTQQEKSQ